MLTANGASAFLQWSWPFLSV
uniref:Uncharacterized protein n=1 Tax=Anguilla anguilla TaxID=7936 RepID=A0A0E9UHD6_ANGAN